MENEVAEPVEAPVVHAAAPPAALNLDALCDEAIVGLDALLERIKGHPDAAGLRSTIAFVKGRFEAEKEQSGQ